MSPRERLDHRIRDKKIARARIRDALRERDGCHCAYCGVALVEDDPMRGESLRAAAERLIERVRARAAANVRAALASVGEPND